MALKPCRLLTLLHFAAFAAAMACRIAVAEPTPDGCGDLKVQFKVKTEKKPAALASPQNGQALVLFIEEKQGEFLTSPTVRYAIDGTWVGANRGPSYFAVQVAPGVHKVCAVRQSKVEGDREVQTRPGLFEAGRTYFYDLTVIRTELGGPERMGSGGLPGNVPDYTVRDKPSTDSVVFTSLAEAEGRAKIASLPMSNSTTQ